MIITISRMFGSGGSDVAKRVADTLGWTLLDDALVDQVASRLGMSRSEVSSMEERVPSFAERLAASLTMSVPELAVPVADASLTESAEQQIVDVTSHVMAEAVRHGDAVLVGRGAQSILADRADALHVFCYASLASLAEYAVAHQGLDAANARDEVERRNKQREQYVRRYWGRDWSAFENYHLCVDTGRLGTDGAARVVVAAARDRFSIPA